MRNKKSDYKYTVQELRPGTWRDYNNCRPPKSIWHLIINVNDNYNTSEDVCETINYDLGPIFGDLSPKSIIDANRALYAADNANLCFSCLVGWKNGTWYADLFLREEWHGALKIKKDIL